MRVSELVGDQASAEQSNPLPSFAGFGRERDVAVLAGRLGGWTVRALAPGCCGFSESAATAGTAPPIAARGEVG